jgi:hypothetical protein
LEVWESLQTKMEESGDGMEHRNPAVATCCVCMEPWTSGGAHRIWYTHFFRIYSTFQFCSQKEIVMCLQLHSVWSCVRQVVPGEVAGRLRWHHGQGWLTFIPLLPWFILFDLSFASPNNLSLYQFPVSAVRRKLWALIVSLVLVSLCNSKSWVLVSLCNFSSSKTMCRLIVPLKVYPLHRCQPFPLIVLYTLMWVPLKPFNYHYRPS